MSSVDLLYNYGSLSVNSSLGCSIVVDNPVYFSFEIKIGFVISSKLP